MTLLRSWLIIYIDDILIVLESVVLVAQHLEVLTHILYCLGFIINGRFDEGPRGLKLNRNYMSEMSECNTGISFLLHNNTALHS